MDPVKPRHFNILLVEDSAAEARLFEVALREVAPGVSLQWVATAAEAIQVLGSVDIAIVDLNMPVTGGFEMLATIKKDPDLMVKPVLVMSNSTNPQDIRRSYAMGANTYLAKPMTLEGIHQLALLVVRYWLELAKLPS